MCWQLLSCHLNTNINLFWDWFLKQLSHIFSKRNVWWKWEVGAECWARKWTAEYWSTVSTLFIVQTVVTDCMPSNGRTIAQISIIFVNFDFKPNRFSLQTMPVVLMVAEKPSLAQSLANILSNGRHRTRKGFNNANSIHEYKSSFRGEKDVFFKFTSVCGHILSTNFASEYNNWHTTDPQELFHCPTLKEEINPKLCLIKFLQKEVWNLYLVIDRPFV